MENYRFFSQMFSQISHTPDFERSFRVKMCGLYAGVYGILKLALSGSNSPLFPGKGGAGMTQCESTRLPPMWPRFDSRSWCHMWDEFVVSSPPCSEGFPPVLRPPQKTTFPNSIWNQWTKSHSVEMPLQNSNLRSNSPPLGKLFTSTSVLPGHCK